MEIYKFSYDDENDALNSLVNYYAVSIEKINSKLRKIKESIDEKKVLQGDTGKYAFYIRSILGADPEPKNIRLRVSHYHRCSSDGTMKWFEDGLLNCHDGLNTFIGKVNLLFPNLINEKIAAELNACSKYRTDLELNFKKGNTGIFAYSRFNEAYETPTYDFPEVFLDLFDRKKSNQLKQELRKILRPTVVKFYRDYDTNDIDRIVFNYWELICQNFDEGRTHNSFDVGKGKTIPVEQIQEIFIL